MSGEKCSSGDVFSRSQIILFSMFLMGFQVVFFFSMCLLDSLMFLIGSFNVGIGFQYFFDVFFNDFTIFYPLLNFKISSVL